MTAVICLFIYYYYYIPFFALTLQCHLMHSTSDVLHLYYFSTCYVNTLRVLFNYFPHTLSKFNRL